MSTKTATKKSNGAKEISAKKVTTNKAGKVIGITKDITESSTELVMSNDPVTKENIAGKSSGQSGNIENAPEPKAIKSKVAKEVMKKPVTANKGISIGGKKIKLAATCYHYYRNWLKEWMRSHNVPSAKFQKAPECYDGHIMVLESEKTKAIKALEQWNKENPETKEMFWDLKK